MPLAGRDPRQRAHAHYKWAQRYAGEGDTARAIPHFGRALYYGERTHGFGRGGNDDDDDQGTDQIVPDDEKVTDLVSFAGLFYVDLPKEEAKALASELVAEWPDQPTDYYQYSRQIPKLQDKFDAIMHEKRPAITRSSGVNCYSRGCRNTPMEKLDTPDGPQVFCKTHAAIVRDNLERASRPKR